MKSQFNLRLVLFFALFAFVLNGCKKDSVVNAPKVHTVSISKEIQLSKDEAENLRLAIEKKDINRYKEILSAKVASSSTDKGTATNSVMVGGVYPINGTFTGITYRTGFGGGVNYDGIIHFTAYSPQGVGFKDFDHTLRGSINLSTVSFGEVTPDGSIRTQFYGEGYSPAMASPYTVEVSITACNIFEVLRPNGTAVITISINYTAD